MLTVAAIRNTVSAKVKRLGGGRRGRKKGQRPLGCRFLSSGLSSPLSEQKCFRCSASTLNELRWGVRWGEGSSEGEEEEEKKSQLFRLCP